MFGVGKDHEPDLPLILVRMRTDAGLTVAELSRRTEMTWNNLHRYETGDKSPSHATVLRIAKACGYELVYRKMQ